MCEQRGRNLTKNVHQLKENYKSATEKEQSTKVEDSKDILLSPIKTTATTWRWESGKSLEHLRCVSQRGVKYSNSTCWSRLLTKTLQRAVGFTHPDCGRAVEAQRWNRNALICKCATFLTAVVLFMKAPKG